MFDAHDAFNAVRKFILTGLKGNDGEKLNAAQRLIHSFGAGGIEYRGAHARRPTPPKLHADTTRGLRKRAAAAALIARMKEPDPVPPQFMHAHARRRALAMDAKST